MPVVGHRADSEGKCEAHEEKAHDLIPEGVHGLHDCRNNVLEERPAVADGLTLPHDFIVTECYWNISLSTRPIEPLGCAVPSRAASVGAISFTAMLAA